MIVPFQDFERKSFVGLGKRGVAYHIGEHNPYKKTISKLTRHRLTIAEARKGLYRRFKVQIDGNNTLAQDPAIANYLEDILARKGKLSESTKSKTLSGLRIFLNYLKIPPSPTAFSELINRTRTEHSNGNLTTDIALRKFSIQEPRNSYSSWAAAIKPCFKFNGIPLAVTITQPKPKRTRAISAGILQAIFQKLPRRELQLIILLQNYAPERIDALCLTPFSAWEDSTDGKHTYINFDPKKCKVNYEHSGIIPRELANEIRAYANALERNVPFPNYETLWREIRDYSLKNFGVRLTSTYIRKRFISIANLTRMNVNDWDYLSGHSQTRGSQANHYQLEDLDRLARTYDTLLMPYLSIEQPRDPEEAVNPINTNTVIEQLQKENFDLKDQILKLTKLLTDTNPFKSV